MYYVGNHIERSDFIRLMVCISILIAFAFIISSHEYYKNQKLIIYLILALLARLTLITSEPKLSDDYYRYYWDGKLIHNKINPYLYKPSEINPAIDSEAFENLNSKNYYSVYPPVAQVIFYLASMGNIKSFIIIYRLIILISEMALIAMLIKWLSIIKLNQFNLHFFYIFNPFVILEFAGNLHLEAITLLFFISALYVLIQKKKLWISSILLSFAVSIKLIPALALPFVIKYLGIKKGIIYALFTILLCVLFFIPFDIIETFDHFLSSIDLFIRSFEFNASIYYLFNTLSSWIAGFNTIAYISPILLLTSFICIIFFVIKTQSGNEQSFIKNMCLAFVLYYLQSTTIHPWYLSIPMCLAIYGNIRYVMIWPFLALLSYSYYGAWQNYYYWIIFLEYSVLLMFFYIEPKNIKLNLPKWKS